MFGMNGFHVSASGGIQGHHGPLVIIFNLSSANASKLVHSNFLPFGKEIEDICFFRWKIEIYMDTIGNIFTSGAATRENITDGVHEMK